MPRKRFPTIEEYYAAVQKAIRMTWQRLSLSYHAEAYRTLPHEALNEYGHVENFRGVVGDCRLFLFGLFRIKNAIQKKNHPDFAQREQDLDGLFYRISDSWRWDDPLTEQVIRVFNDYTEEDAEFDLPSAPLHEPDIEAIEVEFGKWEIEYQAGKEEDKVKELERRREYYKENNWRLMPHLPDPRSMRAQRSWAEDHRKKHDKVREMKKAASEHDVDYFEEFSTAFFIQGYTDYLVNRPLNEVRTHLWQGCEYAYLALDHGFEAHAWYVNDYLHEALAVNHNVLAQRLVNMRQEDWDTDRIRPVNWLITQIKLVMEMFVGRETDLEKLIETNRIGLFEEKLPSELDVDLPMMRNMYFLLRALVERKGVDFNKHLAERMPLREAHFTRGGTIAPIALIDVHGLALCRLALKRKLVPKINHVYLPLELLSKG